MNVKNIAAKFERVPSSHHRRKSAPAQTLPLRPSTPAGKVSQLRDRLEKAVIDDSFSVKKSSTSISDDNKSLHSIEEHPLPPSSTFTTTMTTITTTTTTKTDTTENISQILSPAPEQWRAVLRPKSQPPLPLKQPPSNLPLRPSTPSVREAAKLFENFESKHNQSPPIPPPSLLIPSVKKVSSNYLVKPQPKLISSPSDRSHQQLISKIQSSDPIPDISDGDLDDIEDVEHVEDDQPNNLFANQTSQVSSHFEDNDTFVCISDSKLELVDYDDDNSSQEIDAQSFTPPTRSPSPSRTSSSFSPVLDADAASAAPLDLNIGLAVSDPPSSQSSQDPDFASANDAFSEATVPSVHQLSPVQPAPKQAISSPLPVLPQPPSIVRPPSRPPSRPLSRRSSRRPRSISRAPSITSNQPAEHANLFPPRSMPNVPSTSNTNSIRPAKSDIPPAPRTLHSRNASAAESNLQLPTPNSFKRLPKAKVVIARKRGPSAEVDHLTQDSLAAPNTARHHSNLETIPARRLVREYSNPKELLEGQVSLVDLHEDIDVEDSLGVDREFGSAFAPATLPNRQPSARRLHSEMNTPHTVGIGLQRRYQREDEYRKRYDEFLDAEELGLRKRGIFDSSHGSTDDFPANVASKQRYKNKKKLFGGKGIGRVDKERQRQERHERHIENVQRRSTLISGALDRVSMAADPWIDFITDTNAVPVSAKAAGPLRRAMKRFFGRGSKGPDLIKR